MRLLVILLIIVALAAGGVFFLLENPDQFKNQITRITESGTGYRIKINGELSWRYWPPIAINVNDLSLARGDEAPFAEFETMSIDVALMPLLTRQTVIDVRDVTLKGGRIALLVNEDGRSNWKIETAGAATAPAADTGSTTLASTIQRLTVRDVRLGYIDRTAGSDYEVILQNITTGELTSGKPFDLNAALSFTDNIANISANITTAGRLNFQSDTGRTSIITLITSIDAMVDGKRYPTFNLTTDGDWRPDERALILKRNDIQVSTLHIAMTGLIALAGSTPRFDGVLNLESADAASLGRDLNLELPVGFIQLESDFGATPETLSFRTLSGRFDDSELKGSASINPGPPMRVKADLRINRLDSNRYLTSTEASAGGLNRPDAATDSELIPVDLLRATHTNATIRVASLRYDTHDLADAKVTVNNNHRNLDVIANASAYGGKIVFGLNSQLQNSHLKNQVRTDIKLNLDGVDVAQLLQMPGITGTISANSDLAFSGTLLSDVNENLTGRSAFNVKDGSLDVRPLKSIAQKIDLLRGKTSSISEWPDVMPFRHMVGQHNFSRGTKAGQVLNAEVENLVLTALGGLDLQAETLNYDVTAMFTQAENGQFKVSKQLSGIRWPLSCSGSIYSAPGELCFGREGAIRELVEDIAAQDLQRRGKEKIEKLIDKKVPDEYKDIARDLLKNLFK